ncbi:MAG: methyltransferase domain-containing protein, partial [Candidatus Eremiobacterota bacterium]
INNIEENPDEKFKNFFNIITCNHVLEHVNDPALVIRNISSMLYYRGIAYFEIPNRYYPPSVLKDEHTSLFAITLLEREEALAYYKIFHPESIYGVGHYLTLDTYMDLFKEAGLMPFILDETFDDYRNDKILETVEEIKHARDMIPEAVKKMIQRKMRTYLKDFSDTLKHDEKKFILHYGVPCWKILCRKI